MNRRRHAVRLAGARLHPPHEDSGAALILAIGFVVMVGAISAGLASLTTSSLNNRGTLEMVRNRQYAAEGAIEDAIALVRVPVVSALTACASSAVVSIGNLTLNGVTIRVDQTNVCRVVRAPDGTVVAQRNVLFSACEQTGGPSCAPGAVIIRAQVNFEQGSSGVVTKTYVQSWSVNG